MCACTLKKSFLIDDILQDKRTNDTNSDFERVGSKYKRKASHEDDFLVNNRHLEQRRNTYPLCPMPVKPGSDWYKPAFDINAARPYAYYRESLPEQILRTQLASMRFLSHPAPLTNPYNLDRVHGIGGWWAGAGLALGGGVRRKGGQVRFSAAQTGALERRFAASKYLSPDERRALAASLRLSDRQVKTWYQNRRAKWRRATPDCDESSPPDTDLDQISDHEDLSQQESPSHNL